MRRQSASQAGVLRPGAHPVVDFNGSNFLWGGITLLLSLSEVGPKHAAPLPREPATYHCRAENLVAIRLSVGGKAWIGSA